MEYTTEELGYELPQGRQLPAGQGYSAEPRPGKTRDNPKAPVLHWAGQIVRWHGWDAALKKAHKKAARADHAAEAFHQDPKRPKNAAAARKSRDKRSAEISAFNHKCTAMEVKAKDGKLRKEGALNIVKGAKHPPFILKLERVANTGYSGAELRTIRAEKGCGRPPIDRAVQHYRQTMRA